MLKTAPSNAQPLYVSKNNSNSYITINKKEKEMRTKSLPLLTILLSLSISLYGGIGVGESPVQSLPVELTSFSASVKGDVVLLNWTTATEVDNYGFEVERASIRSKESNYSATSVAIEWKTLGFVNGHGNSNSPKEYSFVDSSPLSGNVSYRLKQIDTDGKFEYSTVIELKDNLSKEYILEQNYPNPFNPTTVISYSIPKASYVSVKVFDVLGNKITTLVSQDQEIGSYKVNFDASTLSNGIYFYKISAGKFSSTKKMLLLK